MFDTPSGYRRAFALIISGRGSQEGVALRLDPASESSGWPYSLLWARRLLAGDTGRAARKLLEVLSTTRGACNCSGSESLRPWFETG